MVAGLVTGIFGAKKAKKAAKKQKQIAVQLQKEAGIQAEAAGKQFEIEREMQRIAQVQANVAAREDRIAQIREARIRRGQILASAANAGVSTQGTSSIQSGVGGLTTQLGKNLGLMNVFKGFAENQSQLGEQSAAQQKIILDSQGRSAVLQGRSDVINANLAKSQATLGLIGSGIEAGMSLFNTGFGGFTSLFGGSKFTGLGGK